MLQAQGNTARHLPARESDGGDMSRAMLTHSAQEGSDAPVTCAVATACEMAYLAWLLATRATPAVPPRFLVMVAPLTPRCAASGSDR
jgi:hypothetical protein